MKIINPTATLIRARPKCLRQTFARSGKFMIMNDRHDPTSYYIAADGLLSHPTTHLVVMEK